MEKLLNEEIPVNRWQTKIKHVKVGRNDVYSISKELKFWERLTCFWFHCVNIKYYTLERPEGSPLALVVVENFCIIQRFFCIIFPKLFA